MDTTAFVVAFTVIDGLAIMLTLYRLFLRLKIQRFWWEDAWAVVVVLFGTTFTVSQAILFEAGPANLEAAFTANWMVLITFTSTIWAVRISLLYSIIRVSSPSLALRKFIRALPVVFILLWTTFIVLKAWKHAKSHTVSTTPLGDTLEGDDPVASFIAYFQLIADCISDATLVIVSLKLFWRVKLPRRQRRMILSLFSSSIVMSAFSLFHAICQLGPSTDLEYLAYDLELTSALIVCNLLVMVTYVYRAFLTSPNGSLTSESETSSEDDDFTTRIPTSTQLLTTVDLNTIYSSFPSDVSYDSSHHSTTA